MSNELVVRQSMALTFDEKLMDIPGYCGLYLVSDVGNVYSLPRNTTPGGLLKPEMVRGGYLQVTLYKNGKPQRHKVHRLVLAAFVGQSTLDTNHKNGVRSDNRLANLEYVTAQGNTADAMKRNGNWQPDGEEHPMAKLTRRQVREIRNLRGQMTQRAIAEKYGVGEAQISRIMNGKRWNNG